MEEDDASGKMGISSMIHRNIKVSETCAVVFPFLRSLSTHDLNIATRYSCTATAVRKLAEGRFCFFSSAVPRTARNKRLHLARLIYHPDVRLSNLSVLSVSVPLHSPSSHSPQ